MRDEPGKTFAGARMRRLRTDRGLTQVALADELGISASYLNQIEHDARPITPAVLGRIAHSFGVESSFFLGDDDQRLVAEMREVLLEHEPADGTAPTDMKELSELVAQHPEFSQAVARLHRRHRQLTEQLAAVSDLRYHQAGTAEAALPGGPTVVSSPAEEVRDWLYQRRNYIHELDVPAEELTSRLLRHQGEVRSELADRLTHLHGIRIVRRVDLGEGVRHRYDPRRRVLELSADLRKGQQAFRMAWELALLEYGDLIDELVDSAGMSSEDARRLLRRALATYFAAATLLPYRQFLEAAEAFRYDFDRLLTFYSVSYETICHRLSTLQRPGHQGIPFSFVRVDRAGNMSKRQSAGDFHFTSTGGTCPLWNVYETFSQPGTTMRQIAEMPDGSRYLWVSRTVTQRTRHFGQSVRTHALGMGCEIKHAARTIYADGLDLTDSAAATPIGAGCRVCERVGCAQRAFPPVNQRLRIDEHSSGDVPYPLGRGHRR